MKYFNMLHSLISRLYKTTSLDYMNQIRVLRRLHRLVSHQIYITALETVIKHFALLKFIVAIYMYKYRIMVKRMRIFSIGLLTSLTRATVGIAAVQQSQYQRSSVEEGWEGGGQCGAKAHTLSHGI